MNVSPRDLNLKIESHRPQSRAKMVIDEAITRYEMAKHWCEPGQIVELICYFNGLEIKPERLGAQPGDLIYVASRIISEDGNHVVGVREFLVPAEQLSFGFCTFNKQSDEPQREIGFHAFIHEKQTVS